MFRDALMFAARLCAPIALFTWVLAVMMAGRSKNPVDTSTPFASAYAY